MTRKSIVLVVCAMAAAAVLAPTLPGSAATVPAASVQPRTVTPSSTLAVIKTISTLGLTSAGIAVNDVDDTVYVADYGSNFVTVIAGGTGIVDDTFTLTPGSQLQGVAVNQADDTVYILGSDRLYIMYGRTNAPYSQIMNLAAPQGIAVNQEDDTVYVAGRFGGSSIPTVWVINGRTSLLDDTATFAAGYSSIGAAVDQGDDTVYIATAANPDLGGGRNGAVSIWNGRFPPQDDTVTVGSGPVGGVLVGNVAVDNDDDTVYVTNDDSQSVSIINPRTSAGSNPIATVKVGTGPAGVAVDQGDDTVYVANMDSDNVSVINGRTGIRTDDTVTVGDAPRGIAVDDSGTNAGLVYVTNSGGGGNSVSVIARATPTLSTPSGAAGDSVTLTVDVPQVAYDVDDSTVLSVAFGNNNATNLDDTAGDAWTMTVPAGSGTVDVIVTFKGGLKALAGQFTYPGGPGPGPAPTPVYPPSAPRDVTATAGDASASVSWVAPADSGSYPITDYQAVASPGGRTCLVAAPSLTCEVSGLTNGTTYTFTVQALNGAGWGAVGGPSNAVTPTTQVVKSIVIAGSRSGGDPRRVEVSGTTTGLVGAQVDPWFRFPGQSSYTEGVGVRTVDTAGTFSWSRKTGKKIYVYFTHGDIKSNTVTIGAS
jgi:YVTN family beta-propeller protein